MKIEYSRHALDSMSRRKINKRLVRGALLNGQKREFQEHGTIKCVYANDGKKLVVIYQQNKDKYKIVTTFYED